MYSDDYGKDNKPKQHKRIAFIIEKLSNGEEVSIKDLAVDFNTSTKTVQRDFTKLQTMMPGLLQRSDDGKKYRKKLETSAQSESEVIIEMLDSMAKSVDPTFYAKSKKLLQQLKPYIDRPFYTRIDVEDIGSHLGNVGLIEQAIMGKNYINFSYTPNYTEYEKTYEKVGVIKIILFNGFWYILCEHEGIFKKFYLKEMKNIDITTERFRPSRDILERVDNSIGIWFNSTVEPFEVLLHVDKEIVIYLQRKPITNNQFLYIQPDGSAELALKITNADEIYPILKYWLPNIRVISPLWLQEEFEDTLKDYLGKY